MTPVTPASLYLPISFTICSGVPTSSGRGSGASPFVMTRNGALATISRVFGSRPRAFASALNCLAPAAISSTGRWDGCQASANSAARRNAAGLLPPIQIGGGGVFRGVRFGLDAGESEELPFKFRFRLRPKSAHHLEGLVAPCPPFRKGDA